MAHCQQPECEENRVLPGVAIAADDLHQPLKGISASEGLHLVQLQYLQEMGPGTLQILA